MPFPLQSLPDPALKHVFRCMTPLELIAISVISTKFSGLVKSLKIRGDHLKIVLRENVTVQGAFQNGTFYINFPTNPNGLDEKPRDIEVDRFDYVDSVWTDPGVKLRTYLERISQNFEWDGIRIRFYTELEVSNIEALSKFFVSVTDTLIYSSCSAEYAQKVLKYFGPVTKNTKVLDDWFRGQEHCSSSLVQSFLISNYDKVHFPGIRLATLENLLTFTAESISIFRANFTPIDVNRFIKLWMKGCNSRLKELCIYFNMQNAIYNWTVVLKGIQYQNVGNDVERKFLGQRRWTQVRGGYDIRGRNGRCATLHMSRIGIELRILFLVWD